MTYTITQLPFSAEIEADILKAFAEHAIDSTGMNGFTSEYSVFGINKDGVNLGVCVCQLFWGNLHIKYLVVKKEYRNLGIGKTLLEHALKYGKKQECNFAFLATMSFQAPLFYQKFGFKVELKRDGYAADTSFYYLKKDLS